VLSSLFLMVAHVAGAVVAEQRLHAYLSLPS
jgi:hypothetical protein